MIPFNFFKQGDSTEKEPTKEHLGGKGYGLAMMSLAGLPVPPGITIPTPLCQAYMTAGQDFVLGEVMKELPVYLKQLEDEFGFMPLVSVRSGAQMSMPGMMETILNVGLTHDNLEAWCDRIGIRSALDSRRRLLQMMGETAFHMEKADFDLAMEKIKKKHKAKTDADMDEYALGALCDEFEKIYAVNGFVVPATFLDQLKVCIKAVFDSWNGEKAKVYRAQNGIPDDLGTAVNIQAMVFGNMNDQSGSGVLFSRNPSSGANEVLGEFLQNAQGEDVVAGIRTPLQLDEMKQMWPEVTAELLMLANKLETFFKDMQDIEFTVQDGKLFLLQTRNGKRTAAAAFKIARDMLSEGLISKEEVLERVSASQYFATLRPVIDKTKGHVPAFAGLGACNGVAKGIVVFDPEEAVKSAEPVILLRKETNPDDIAGMYAAVGILTSTGGATSHAAVVARAMDKPCIVGASAITVDEAKGTAKYVGPDGQAYTIIKGDLLTIDGLTGEVYRGEVPVIDGTGDENVAFILELLKEMHGVVYKNAEAIADHCVMAAEFFPIELVAASDGDVELAVSKLVEGLKKAGNPDTMILDMTPVERFVSKNDHLLWDLYKKDYLKQTSEKFSKVLVDALWTNRQDLKGLTIYSTEKIPSKLTPSWFKTISYPKTLAEALKMKTISLSPEFVANVMGDMSVWPVLEKLGLKIAATPVTKAEAVVNYLKTA